MSVHLPCRRDRGLELCAGTLWELRENLSRRGDRGTEVCLRRHRRRDARVELRQGTLCRSTLSTATSACAFDPEDLVLVVAGSHRGRLLRSELVVTVRERHDGGSPLSLRVGVPRAARARTSTRWVCRDRPGTGRVPVEVEPVHVEGAHVGVVRPFGIPLAGPLVDLHRAVVSGRVR